MKSPFRLGIVGCGGMGKNHLQAALRSPAFELAAVCDVNPAALAGVPEGVPRYASAEEMFSKEQMDVASLILPNHLYESTVQFAADRGVHVLCEKPLGHTLASCQRILEIAREHNIRGWVSSQRKYLPHFQAAREKLATLSIDFVNVVFTYYWSPAFSGMGWRGDPKKSGGVAVIDSGWHVFDALMWLMGSPETVFAQVAESRTVPGIDEKAAIQLRYPAGALANLTISYTVPQNTFEFLFAAHDKALVITYESMCYFEGGHLVESVEPKEKFDVMDRMYSELSEALAEPGAVRYITTFAQAESIMKVIDACYRSAATEQLVQIAS